MIRLTNGLKLIILTTIITGCQSDKYDTSDISGTWYYAFRDSIYCEVIFTKNRLWDYSENEGTYSTCYTIQNDTFEIKDNLFKVKLIRKNRDEFDLASKTSTTRYFRLKIPIDTIGLLNNDEDAFDKYVDAWKERKHKWEKGFKKRNE